MNKFLFAKLFAIGCLSLVPRLAIAGFPDRAIHIVVPYSAGGSTDIAARIVAESLTKQIGAAVIIENRPGASGFIGAGLVARAKPDGYTLLFAGNGIATAPSMKEVTFDIRKDLTPISRIVASQFSILVNPKLPVNTLQELLAYAKANPGKLNFACSGAMTAAHFALEGFRQAAGLDFVTIQFAGNAPAVAAMLAGEPLAGIDAAFSAKGAVSSGMLRALAVTGAKRSPLLPDVPTASEAGVPGYVGGFSLVMLAPGGTPKTVVDKIYQAIVASLKDQAVMSQLEGQGMEPVGNSPEEYGVQLETEIQQSAKIIDSLKDSGVVK